MAETAYITPSSSGQLFDFGSDGWTSPSNTGADDGNYANYLGRDSFGLYRTNLGSSTVPAGATINRVIVEVKWKTEPDEVTTFAAFQAVVKLVKGDAIVGNNKSTGAQLPSTDSSYTVYDFTPAQWNVTLTATDINSSGIGFIIGVNDGGFAQDAVADVGHMRMKIDYTAASGNSGFFQFL